MPIGGTEVGDAWIRIHSEGRGLKGEIKRDAEAAARDAGKSGSKEFGQVWAEGLSTIGQRTQREMLKSGTLSGNKFGKAFEDAVGKRFADVEHAMVQALTSGDFGEFEKRFGGIRQATDAVADALGRLRAAGQLTARDFDQAQTSLAHWAEARGVDEATKAWDRLGKEMSDAIRMNEHFDTQRAKAMQDWGRMMDAAIAQNERFDAQARATWEKQARLVEQAGREMEREFTKRADADGAAWERQARMVERAAFEMQRHFDKIARDAERSADKAADAFDIVLIGRLKGSRNNFANAVGSLFAPLEKASSRLIRRALDPLFARLSGVFAAMDNLGEGAGGSRLLKMVGDLAAQLPVLVTGLAAFVGVAAVASLALGVLVSAVSALLGVLTALAGSAAFAVAGVLLPLGPLALAAAAGIGTLVAAFSTLDGELDDSVKGIKDWFGGVADQVRANLFGRMAGQIAALTPVLENFVGPLLTATASALADAGDRLVAGLQSPGVVNSLTILRDTLPGIMGSLAGVLGNLLTGILGFFAPIAQAVAPLIATFDGLTRQFSDWANSATGQNTIGEFFDRAWDSASVLWDVVVNVADALGSLFSQGKEDGDGMLQTLSDLVGRFAEFADSAGGREAISDWFDRARTTAGHVADAVGKIVTALADMDTPENHQALNAIIDAFGFLASAINAVDDEVRPVINAISDLVEKAQDLWAWLNTPVTVGGFSTVEDAAGTLGDKLEDLVGWFQGLPGRIGDALSGLGASVGGWFSGVWESASTAVATGIDGIVGWFTALPGRIAETLTSLPGTLWAAFSDGLVTVAGLLATGVAVWVNVFTSLPQRILDGLAGLVEALLGFFWNLGTSIGGAAATAVGAVIGFFQGLPDRTVAAVSTLQGSLTTFFTVTLQTIIERVATGIAGVVAWFITLPGRARQAVNDLGNQLYQAAVSGLAQMLTGAAAGAGNLIGWFQGLPGRITGAVGNLGSVLYGKGQELIQGLLNGVGSLIGRVASAITNGLSGIKMPSLSLPKINVPWNASGSIVSRPTLVGAGEAGPEAIVPLNRPLSQVDPSVRAISALLQGKGGVPWMKQGGVAGGTTQTVMPGAIQVISRASNPTLVAHQVLDGLAVAMR